MNKWVEKSINLANSDGYLDKLMDVYPINLSLIRNLSDSEIEEIKNLFHKKRIKELISFLLDLEKFPIDDSYIGFFRKNRESLNKNPKTIKRIGKRLLKMGLDELLIGATKAKSPSRKVGPEFRNWLYKIGYPILQKNDFLDRKNKVAILEGSDSSLVNFAKEELDYKGSKGLDAVLRIGDKFVIAEAKFITSNGGTQHKSFREGVSFVKDKNKNFIKIAIFDGVVWVISDKIKNKRKLSLYETVINLKNDEIILSTLLLKDFVNEL